jgi:hypothetical protein
MSNKMKKSSTALADQMHNIHKNFYQQIFKFLLGLTLLTPWLTQAQTSWGVIPLSDQPYVIEFGRGDITKNFTDNYLFSISGEAGAAYIVTVSYDSCSHGCGNVAVDYGIYEQNGALISNDGKAILESGAYDFQVKGTGMGSGNNLTYSGTITFTKVAVVAPVPEPAETLLFLVSAGLLAWSVLRQRSRQGQPLPA